MLLSTLIFLCLFVLYGVLISYYQRAWTSIPMYSPGMTGTAPPQTRISVLVPARNEEANIGPCLESLSRQSYSKDLYEVIVIDDHSSDRTWDILNSAYFPGMIFRPVQLAGSGLERLADNGSRKAYKKLAIEVGVRMATGELIVTTDADCLFPPDWLKTLAAFYEETGAKCIAAPVRIGSPAAEQAADHSFLSIFQTLDFITLQGITGASVYKKFHSMCNGANLAYEKTAFQDVDGFRDIDNIPSGDDMLLMHKIFTKYPEKVFFLKNKQATVSTRPETSWNAFFNQRIRWASKADSYDDQRIFRVLLSVYLLNLILLGLIVASFWNYWYLLLLLVLLLIKTAIEYPFVRSVASFFGQQKLMIYFPAMEPFHILYTVGIGWLGKFGSYRWKERKNK